MDKEMMNFEANFSVLDRYGTNITQEEYITDPAIGRDQQIKDLILVLLTPEKSAILIGKPGIGKTAIVEGLAYRIQKNDVPEALKGYTILNIKTASLLGTMPSGESKVQKMIDELKTKEKMILFIDEIHMLIGSTETSSLDFANIFKEGLGRGSIKVIGATTTEEYEKYILRDKAFTRRFQKIEVPEPTREETIQIMMGTLPKFEKQTGRKMKYTPFLQERIMSFIVDITSEYKRIFSLGSRYPDVCLTLLKQAFSYTVYDNRPYMDIFDIRKAIENSKNIYSDVIKKELPNFDKMFNDIMLEEKGEKPVEEWKKDDIVPNEIEEEKNIETKSDETISKVNKRNKNNKQDDDSENLSVLEKVPELIDRVELKTRKPVNSIITSSGRKKYAKVGAVAAVSGLKEKLNGTTNSAVLDDMILSSDIGTLRLERPNNRVTNYVVTDELKNGVSDQFLLEMPVLSNLEREEENIIEKERYRTDKRIGGNHMWNNNEYRPERQDLMNQNFDKYQNYFHQENNMNDQNFENEKRIDMLMSGRNDGNQMYNQGNNSISGPMGMPMNQGMPMNGPMGMPMNPGMPMNGPMGMPMDQGMPMNVPMGMPMNQGMPMDQGMPMNGPMGMPINQGMPMNGPMGMPMDQGMPMNGPMGMPMNQGIPMNGPMGMPMNQVMPMNGPMGMPMNQGMPMNGPMDGPMDNPINGSNQSSTNDNPLQGFLDNNKNKDDSLLSTSKKETLFGAPMYDSKDDDSSSGETLFGAPMYSSEEKQEKEDDKTVDIYGQLIADNMSLKNGEIVNEFPTFEKLNNLNNITTSMRNSENVEQNYNNGYNQNNGFNNMMMNNQGMNQMPNRNWTFIGNQNNNQQPNTNNTTSYFQKNILDDIPKNKEENKTNLTMPTNNKDYYEDMKSGEFVNLSDLNSGKVKEEDTNKYMGISVTENKPQFDLNIEGNSEEEDKFDDFYE